MKGCMAILHGSWKSPRFYYRAWGPMNWRRLVAQSFQPAIPSGDWKVAPTRRLENLRYIAVHGRSVRFALRRPPETKTAKIHRLTPLHGVKRVARMNQPRNHRPMFALLATVIRLAQVSFNF